MKILLALLFTVNLFGTASPDYITTNYYDPSVVISFDTWKSESLTIKISDMNSEVLYFDKVKTNNADGIRYNLKHLNDGKYTIRLENSTKLVEEKVILINGKIVEKDADVYYKPAITVNSANAKVSFLSYNKKANVKLVSNGTVIFEELVSDAKPLNKVYNLNKLDKGNYTLSVSNDKVSRSVNFRK